MSRNGQKNAKSLRAAPGNKTRVKKNRNSLQDAAAGSNWLIPRRHLAFPDSLRTNLRYILPLQQVTGGGTTNSLRFTSNAYDVDSALASTAMAYFAELAVVYSRFRTLAMRYEFMVTNQEAFPQGMVYGFMIPAVTSTGLGQNYASNPYMNTNILSESRGNRSTATYTGRVKIDQLFGSAQALYDDTFTGSTTSSSLPSTSTANLYIGAVSAAVPVNGWLVTGWIELDVLFHRRNSLLV